MKFVQNIDMQNVIEITGLKVILVDDHEIFCQGLKEIFKRMNPENFFQYFTSVKEAKEEMKKQKYQFLLCDLLIPDMDMKEFITYCKQKYPGLLIIILSPDTDIGIMKEYFSIGVSGFINKGISYYELKLAMEKVYQGEKYISADLNSRLTNSFFLAEKNKLSIKELETIRLIAAGNTVNQIANIQHLSTHTVMTHRRNIMKKLNLHSGIEIVKYAFENNLI